jgi:hypothetical protein
MTTTQITDHQTQALARLHEFHKNRTNIVAFINAITAPHQDIENAMWQLFTERTIDTAIGVQLDDIGTIVGQPRNGLSDDDYRRHIRAKISVSQSNGRVFDIIAVARAMLGDSTVEIEIDQTGTAAVVVRLTGTLITDTVADFLIAFLRDTVAAGVRVILQHLQVAESGVFTETAAATIAAYTAFDPTITINSTEGLSGFPLDGGVVFVDAFGASPEGTVYTKREGSVLTISIGLELPNSHGAGSDIRLTSDDVAKGHAAAETFSGVHGIGVTTINVTNSYGLSFPATGSLVLEKDTANEETVTYTGRTATQFTGVSATTISHADGAAIEGVSGGQYDRAVE